VHGNTGIYSLLDHFRFCQRLRKNFPQIAYRIDVNFVFTVSDFGSWNRSLCMDQLRANHITGDCQQQYSDADLHGCNRNLFCDKKQALFQ